MQAQDPTETARSLEPWVAHRLHSFPAVRADLIRCEPVQLPFDAHELPETLIAVKGRYAIETPERVVDIPEGTGFTVPPGLPHRPCNGETCIILVLR